MCDLPTAMDNMVDCVNTNCYDKMNSCISSGTEITYKIQTKQNELVTDRDDNADNVVFAAMNDAYYEYYIDDVNYHTLTVFRGSTDGA